MRGRYSEADMLRLSEVEKRFVVSCFVVLQG